VLEEATTTPVLGYYAQDYEPYFFAATDPRRREAFDSYRQPGLRIFTKTEWTRALIAREAGVDPTSIGPSLDTQDWYPPSTGRSSAPIGIAAMVRPSTPRRAPKRTLSLLQALLQARGDAIQIEVFGVDTEDQSALGSLAQAPNCQVHGVLGRQQMLRLLARSHIFIDASDFQAMGLTCMEAMACGVAVVGPLKGGLSEILHHDHNGLLVDTSDEAACLNAMLELVDQPSKRQALVEAALTDIANYDPESAALRMMNVLFPRA
ncbi:glycosyltransferase family 4 protein, partial [Halochromatium sp.]